MYVSHKHKVLGKFTITCTSLTLNAICLPHKAIICTFLTNPKLTYMMTNECDTTSKKQNLSL